MNSYRWHAHGITPGGVHFTPSGRAETTDPHQAASVIDSLLRQYNPGATWLDFHGRPEGPGDRFMPVLITAKEDNPSTTYSFEL